eukprot:6480932-Amphidinium_carterae.1
MALLLLFWSLGWKGSKFLIIGQKHHKSPSKKRHPKHERSHGLHRHLEIGISSFEGLGERPPIDARHEREFLIHKNDFKGTIPESGIRRMNAVTDFGINENSFEGALPAV